MNGVAYLIGTWFYCGLAPKGPGTAGSAGAMLVAWLLARFAGFSAWEIGLLGIVFTPVAIWASGSVAGTMGGPGKAGKDPQIVVVDEVVGQWLAIAGATELNPVSWIAAFALFRMFDILKPPPVRALEKLPGGVGIVMDDLGAGVYAALVLFAAGWFNLY